MVCRKDLQQAAFEIDAAKKLCLFLTEPRELTAEFEIGALTALATICQNLPGCRQQVSSSHQSSQRAKLNGV